jgi:hypothetical protein
MRFKEFNTIREDADALAAIRDMARTAITDPTKFLAMLKYDPDGAQELAKSNPQLQAIANKYWNLSANLAPNGVVRSAEIGYTPKGREDTPSINTKYSNDGSERRASVNLNVPF